jgi:hypothetical protein
MKIYRDYGEISSELIEQFEKTVNYQLPTKYVNLVRKHDAVIPENNGFTFRNIYGEKDERDVNFYSFKKDNECGFIFDEQENVNNLTNYGYLGIVTFAVTANGDYVCFDYRNNALTANPKVVLLYHDDFIENEDSTSSMVVNHVADSFEDFMDMLHE